MRTSIVAALLSAGLAVAQDLDIEGYSTVLAVAPPPTGAPYGADPTTTSTVSFDSTAILALATSSTSATSILTQVIQASNARRQEACTTRSFNGPQVTVPADSAAAFLAYQPFSDDANDAVAPGDYLLVPDFQDLQGSAQSNSYLTYTAKITAYDPLQCAQVCDTIDNCVSFNIYYERDPLVVYPASQAPNSLYCPANSTSPSATLIKCAFFSKPLTASEATNTGQYQEKFQLVIAASNAYSKPAPLISGYLAPVDFGNAAMNIPPPVGANGYMRVQTFGTNVPFDPAVCAASCASQTGYNQRHGGPACIMFNAYLLYENNANPVFTCTYYSVEWDPSYATNVGQYDKEGDHFTIGSSYGYYQNPIP